MSEIRRRKEERAKKTLALAPGRVNTKHRRDAATMQCSAARQKKRNLTERKRGEKPLKKSDGGGGVPCGSSPEPPRVQRAAGDGDSQWSNPPSSRMVRSAGRERAEARRRQTALAEGAQGGGHREPRPLAETTAVSCRRSGLARLAQWGPAESRTLQRPDAQ